MGRTLDVSAQAAPSSLFIRADGSMLYMLSRSSDSIYRYSLSTAYNVDTGAYDTGQILALPARVTWSGMWFDGTGTKLYACDDDNNQIHQYTLSTAWDLTSASSDGTYDVSGQLLTLNDVVVSDDGSGLYASDGNLATIVEYALTTAFDITGTVTYVSTLDVSGTETTPRALFMRGGTSANLFIADYSDVHRFTMSTAWDSSTATFDTGQVFTRTENAGNLPSTTLSSDGVHLYDVDGSLDVVHQYDLTTAWDVTTAAFDPPTASDGAVIITPTVSATASTDHSYADGAVTVSQTVAATAKINTLHADGSVTATPTVSATGRVEAHANAAVTLAQTVTATATNATIHADGAVSTAQTVAATGEVQPVIAGNMTIPALTIAAAMSQTLPTNITLPALVLDAAMLNGNVASTVYPMRLPSFTMQALGGNDVDVTLPALEIDAVAISSNQMSADAYLRPLTMVGTFGDARVMAADVSLPALRTDARILGGSVYTGDVELPSLRIDAVMSTGKLLTAAMLIPALEMDAVMTGAGLITAELSIPALEMAGFMEALQLGAYSAWCTNTENMLTSEYVGYDFLDIAHVFDRYIGVTADGIFDLTGIDDDGVQIDADVLFGLDSFRTEDLKRVKAVHMGYRADNDGDLEVQIVVDGEGPVRKYPVKKISHSNGVKRGRATIAKGLKSRYWQYGFSNVLGADFTVDDLNIYVQQHNRKAQ